MNLSYWEQKTWFTNIDFAIIGSGIVGLNCALALRNKYPKAKIVVFEKGILPAGASTKNAGFACFGSLSEIIDDLNTHAEEEVVSLVNYRKSGLEQLRSLLGDTALNYKAHGGYEVFTKQQKELYELCSEKLGYINNLLSAVFNENIFSQTENIFGFSQTLPKLLFNKFEGQIDTGKMMFSLLSLAQKNNIIILNNLQVTDFIDTKTQVTLQLNNTLEVNTHQVFFATNGFAKELLNVDVKPARAQVLITKPIKNLAIKGTFHLDRGYYYFRNIDNRILLGGGRNLDFKTEETTVLETTTLIQAKLEELLQHTILPNTSFEIESRWSGIMGVGPSKKPIIKQISENVYCGVRLGGMGVAIGSFTGKKLAELLDL